MPSKTLISRLAILFGFLGVVACAVAIAVAWSTGSRLRQVNRTAFEGINETLGTVRDRVLEAQDGVQESKVMADDIRQNLNELTRKKAGEKLEARFAIENKTETLSQGLQQADLWLELSTSSIQSVQEVFELGYSLGAPLNPSSVEPLVGKLVELQSQLNQATEIVDGIHERATEIAEEPPRKERMEQAFELAVRAVVTFGKIDSRLGEFAVQLFETQAKAQQMESRTHAYLVAAQIVVMLLIAWMAAGQVCLCLVGWKG